MGDLDIFSLPPVDYRYEAHRYVEYNPTLTGIDPITFSIPQTDDFVDLSESRLVIELRMNNGAAGYEGIKMNDAVSDANSTRNTYVETNIGHTLWRQIDLSINGALVTPQGNNYHHQAYIETLLNYSKEDGKTKLEPQGWTNDVNVPRTIARTGGADDTPAPAAGDMNAIAPGMYALTSKLQQKRWYTFTIRPHLPVFTSGRLLVPGVEIKMDLHLNPMSQLLLQTGNLDDGSRKNPIITAEDIKVKLVLKKVTLNAKVYLSLQQQRTSGKKIVHYPVVRGDIRTFSIPTGFTRWEQDNLFLGRVPDEVCIVFMHTDVYNGSATHHTFAYERHGVKSISQAVNGEEYPYRPLQLSTTANNKGSTDSQGYERLLTSLNMMRTNKQPMILPEDWGHGKNCTVFYFNNVPSGDPNNPSVRNPRQSGNVRYTVEFEGATTYNITVLVFSSLEHDLRINYQNGVQYEAQA